MKVGWEGGEMVGMMGKICERNRYEGKNRDGHALGTSCT